MMRPHSPGSLDRPLILAGRQYARARNSKGVCHRWRRIAERKWNSQTLRPPLRQDQNPQALPANIVHAAEIEDDRVSAVFDQRQQRRFAPRSRAAVEPALKGDRGLASDPCLDQFHGEIACLARWANAPPRATNSSNVPVSTIRPS